MKLSIVVAVVVLVLQIRSSVTTLMVLDGDLANTTIITAQLFKKGDYFSIFFDEVSGELVLDNATSVDGKIVYLVLIPNSFYTTVKELQNRGAIGILTADSGIIPGRLYCTYNNEDFLNEILIPIAQANYADLAPILSLLRNGDSINITISSEGNQWRGCVQLAWIFGRLIYSIIGSALCVYAIVKLALFIHYQGSQFNVPQICLAIEFIGNCIRVVYLAGDPNGCFFNYNFGMVAVFQALNGLFTQPTFFLITMYWHEAMTDASVRIYPFLSKLKIPFYVFTCVLLFLAVLFPLLNEFLGVKFTTAITAMYAAIALAFLIFYIITIVKIMRRLHVATKMTNKSKHLMEISRNMIMSGVAKFATIAVGFLFVGESIATRPIPYVSLWAVLYVLLYFDSFCRIWTFSLDAAKSLTSSSGPRSSSLIHGRSRAQTTQIERSDNNTNTHSSALNEAPVTTEM